MTIMHVTLVGVNLRAEQKSDLARKLIAAFCEIEVGRDVAAAHTGFVVRIDEAHPDSVFLGDQPMTSASAVGRAAIVQTQVMAGPWNDAMKASLFERLEAIVRDAAAMPKQGTGADFWMTIVEVPDGAWGVGGRPVPIARLAPFFTDDRQERIRDHLRRRNEERP